MRVWDGACMEQCLNRLTRQPTVTFAHVRQQMTLCDCEDQEVYLAAVAILATVNSYSAHRQALALPKSHYESRRRHCLLTTAVPGLSECHCATAGERALLGCCQIPCRLASPVPREMPVVAALAPAGLHMRSLSDNDWTIRASLQPNTHSRKASASGRQQGNQP